MFILIFRTFGRQQIGKINAEFSDFLSMINEFLLRPASSQPLGIYLLLLTFLNGTNISFFSICYP